MKLDRSTVDRYLEPRMLAALSRLPLTSRRVVEGAMMGTHRSPFKGFSTEFADHREYTPGDDLKHLDWKVFSRTDRYYIKQYEENTNLRAHILLDCSASMAFPAKPKVGDMSKYQYGCHLAAGLGYVLIAQQDPVGLVLFNDEIVTQLPAMRSLAHLRRILHTIDQARPGSRTNAGKALQGVVAQVRRRGLLILISDLMDEPDRIVQALAHFRQRGHDVIVIQLLHQTELNLPFEKVVTLRDMETGDRITIDGAEVAAEYRRQIDAFVDRYKQCCFEQGFDFVLANTSVPYDALLTALLTRRQR